MKSLIFAASALASLSAASAAYALPACVGDFMTIDGDAIADPRCQRGVAEMVAAGEHVRISRNPVGSHEISREQFCLGNNDIRADAYCAPFKD